MKTEDIGKEVVEKLKELPEFDKIRFVYLYGSLAYGKKTERSDIDICIYCEMEKGKLHDLLFRLSGSLPEKYDVQIFQLLPLYIKKEIFKGELLYADDKGFVYDIARRTIKEYEDFEPRYKRILYGKAGMEVPGQ